MTEPSTEDIELARELLTKWDEGRGISKSQLEIKTWNDATAHGAHFDRFISKTLGISTRRRSRQTDRIGELEKQVRSLGHQPVGAKVSEWEAQLQHARSSCIQALRIWNDPMAVFRTGGFATLFVTAWNGLAIALLMRDGLEWRELDSDGDVVLVDGGIEKSRDTRELIGDVFGGADHFGLRQNVGLWIELRNAVVHRSLPALDAMAIPYAQAGLLNFETAIVEQFGQEFALGESLSVPLQLSGFRDPGVLASRKLLFGSLPLEVQGVLSRAEAGDADLISDPTFMLRVAFIPAVPSSGRNPDAIAYFVRPGEVPDELAESLDRYVILAKPQRSACNFRANHVVAEVTRRTGFKFHYAHHSTAARSLGAWPPESESPGTVEARLADYNSAFKGWVYSQAWIDLLVERTTSETDFLALTGRVPKRIDIEWSHHDPLVVHSK